MALRGKVVAITRPENQAYELAKLISRIGGQPYMAPTVEIKPSQNRRPIKDFISKLLSGQIDFVIFMSVNGVTTLIDSLKDSELKTNFLKELNKATVVAVGPKTRRTLEGHGINVKMVPFEYSSEGMVKSLKKMRLRGKNVAIPRSISANAYLHRELEKIGANVLEVPVYQSVSPSDDSRVLSLINDLTAEKIDIITFTSSSTVRNLFKIASKHALADKLRNGLKKTFVVVIGPTTQRTIKKLRVRVDVMPRDYTVEGMIKALVNYYRIRRQEECQK